MTAATGSVGDLGICPHCFMKFEQSLPLEPLYTLDFAAGILNMTNSQLRGHLSRHRAEFPKRYRKDIHHRLHRRLTASEIRKIRASRLIYKNPDGSKRDPSPYAD